MSEQAEKTRRMRAKRWAEAEGREVLREWRESGQSAVKFAAQRGITATRLSYWEERLGQKAAGGVSFVAVPLSSQHAVGGLSFFSFSVSVGAGRFELPTSRTRTER